MSMKEFILTVLAVIAGLLAFKLITGMKKGSATSPTATVTATSSGDAFLDSLNATSATETA